MTLGNQKYNESLALASNKLSRNTNTFVRKDGAGNIYLVQLVDVLAVSGFDKSSTDFSHKLNHLLYFLFSDKSLGGCIYDLGFHLLAYPALAGSSNVLVGSNDSHLQLS